MATDASQWPMEAFQLRVFAMYIKNRNKSRQIEREGERERKGDRAGNKVNKCAKKSNKCKREKEREKYEYNETNIWQKLNHKF